MQIAPQQTLSTNVRHLVPAAPGWPQATPQCWAPLGMSQLVRWRAVRKSWAFNA